jgi:wyosine [tRNA(Phe)-imidazoG37] synthetase (radical SAM superfamily)
MIAFGPIPSRRLGHSLGINNIPPKVCTYSCVYCQLGRTDKMGAERGAFFQTEEILRAVTAKVEQVRRAGEAIDFLTFVPDGEPTLDIHLGREIELLKALGIKIAVITNSSLIWRTDVRADLMKADWISLKLDSVQERIWRDIDRPHRALSLDSILRGMLAFREAYRGELVTETMLVGGLNDRDEELRGVADFLVRLRPDRAYLSIPIRPPAEEWVSAPPEETVNRAYQILSERVKRVECLVGYEGNAFAFTGDVEDDILSITAVHPMREEAVSALLARAKADWSVIRKLITAGQLKEAEYEGKKFYMRKFL